jgi:chemotaxis receptor (MCP) glutamine deamidase CheD
MYETGSAAVLEVEIGACAVAVGDFDLVIPHLTTGLALCLYDDHDVTGVAYALRGRSTPDERAAAMRPGLFVDLALPEMLRMMDERGARRTRRAALVGAAAGVGWRRANEMAGETAAAARKVLGLLQIPVVHEVLGGGLSRALWVNGLGRLRIDTAREVGKEYPLSSSSAPPSSLPPSSSGADPAGLA